MGPAKSLTLPPPAASLLRDTPSVSVQVLPQASANALREHYRRWQRQRREQRVFDPHRAPHRNLVRQHIDQHLPALQRKVRQSVIDDLTFRVLHIERSPFPLIDESEPWQLHRLVLRMAQVIARIDSEMASIQRRFGKLSQVYGQIEDTDERRRLLALYLSETVPTRKALRQDLRALKRWLDLDALRERNAKACMHLDACIDVGLWFIGHALDAALSAPDQCDQPAPNDFIGRDRTDAFLLRQLDLRQRWQSRHAIIDALCRLYRHDGELVLRPGMLDTVAELASDRNQHPWVQAGAIEVVARLKPGRGSALIERRLLARNRDQRDFLVRALLVPVATQVLPPVRGLGLLSQATRDPSEHVRLKVCQHLPDLLGEKRRLGPGLLIAELRKIAALPGTEAAGEATDAAPLPASPRIRAMCAISIRNLVRNAGGPDHIAAAGALLIDLIRAGLGSPDLDRTRLQDSAIERCLVQPARTACEELAALAEELTAAHRQEVLERLAPNWQSALAAIIEHPDAVPSLVECVATAADVISRELCPERRQATSYLRDLVPQIAPGDKLTISLERLPAAVAAQCKAPLALGRILADLSRREWGLSARVRRGQLTVWRGDHMGQRTWRALHELRNPAPDKREDLRYTTGRLGRGELRAPPTLLDEAAPSGVPGERVRVAREGSWGRHLPAVDDLSLAIWRPRPVRLFSTHGVTTILPAGSLWARLWSRISVSRHYKALFYLRQQCLAADEPRQRARYLKTVNQLLGISITFAPHKHLGTFRVNAPVGQRLRELFPT